MTHFDEKKTFKDLIHTPTNRRTFLRRVGTSVAVIGASCLVDGFFIEPSFIDETYHQLYSNKMSEKIRIAHLTDLHLEDDYRRDHAPDLVNNANPDLVLLTGDYLNHGIGYKTPISRLESYVNRFKPKYGTYASLGNWDLGQGKKYFNNTDVNVLENRITTLSLNRSEINIIGINNEAPNLAESLLKPLDKTKFNVLMYHNPDLIEDIAPYQTTDLYLAGHTHGGQVRIPFRRLITKGSSGDFPYAGAIITLSKFKTKYQSGMFKVNDTTLYVNRGIGMEGGRAPRVRFFCPPEIAYFDILPI